MYSTYCKREFSGHFSREVINKENHFPKKTESRTKVRHRANENRQKYYFMYYPNIIRTLSSRFLPKTKTTEFRPFLRKLNALLEEAEEKGFQDFICWQSGGKSFKVLESTHDSRRQ
jgi:hypothetical protein